MGYTVDKKTGKIILVHDVTVSSKAVKQPETQQQRQQEGKDDRRRNVENHKVEGRLQRFVEKRIASVEQLSVVLEPEKSGLLLEYGKIG